MLIFLIFNSLIKYLVRPCVLLYVIEKKEEPHQDGLS